MKLLLFSNIKGSDLYLPLNLLSIGTYAKSLGVDVRVIDGQIETDWHQAFLRESRDADIVGVSSYTGPSIHGALTVIKSLRQNGFASPIVWGGYHGSLAGGKLIQEGYADIVVQGYGEHAMGGIIRWRNGEESLENVPNIVFRSSQGVQTNQIQPVIDQDLLPSLDYSFVDVFKYYNESRRIVHYVSSYGCPYACTFCAEPTHSKRRWNGFSVERIVDDLSRIQLNYRPDRISFVDPNMSSDPTKVVALARELKGRSPSVLLNCNMRARDIVMMSQQVDLGLLYEAGFRRVFIGVESGSNAQLKKLKKASFRSDHLEAVLKLDRAGIETQASFMHDLPGESEEEAQETISLARELLEVKTPGSIQSHHFFMPYPGVELSESLAEGLDLNIASVSQEDWAKTSTFRGSSIWRGNPQRREWVIEELTRLNYANESVISTKEIERLKDKATLEHDYVDRFML